MRNIFPTMLVSLGFVLAAPCAIAGDVFTMDNRKLETIESFAVLTDEFFNGKTLALKILYTPKAITPEIRKDLLEEELKKFLAEYSFDGSRLRLKSQGSYRSEDFGEVHTVTWKVASDLPVHKLGAAAAH